MLLRRRSFQTVPTRAPCIVTGNRVFASASHVFSIDERKGVSVIDAAGEEARQLRERIISAADKRRHAGEAGAVAYTGSRRDFL